MSDRLLNEIPEVCARTCLGRSKVYALIDSGELGSVKVGKRRLIPEAALLAFVDQLQASPGSRAS